MVTIPNQRSPRKQLPAERAARPGRSSDSSASSDQDVDGRRLLPARLLVHPAVVVGLEGAVDARAVVGLCRQLCGLRWQACTLVVLDTSGVSAVSPAGMGALQAVGEALARAGHRLWLWATPAVLFRALEVAGVDEDLVPLVPRERRRVTDQLEAMEAGARLAVGDVDLPAPLATVTPAEPPGAAGVPPTGGGL